MQYTRKSGILLHPTCLPGAGGIGSLGTDARCFIDFLQRAGQSLWQVLPLGPVAYGNSPYSCYSAFAGNPLLIDLGTIAAEGDITIADLQVELPDDRVDFPRVEQYKIKLLRRAAANFLAGADRMRVDEFRQFCDTTSWLHDYALFMAVKDACHGKSWNFWPEGIARRRAEALTEYAHQLGAVVEEQKYMQWQFYRQWHEIRSYAHTRGVEIVGDLPIFVAPDSADVWANPQLFHLDERGRPAVVAGVPPDYFSETGQLWGNPVFDWERVADRDFDWWLARMHFNLRMFDLVRVDHFRGLESFWAVASEAKTAIVGDWLPAKGHNLFGKLKEQLGNLNVIAEDLGVITPEVEKLRDDYNLPGMKVLQFAFGSDATNENLPHNYSTNFLVYTGTHDNDTSLGWFNSIDKKERRLLHKYIAGNGKQFVRNFIEEAWKSAAFMAIIPMQDVLGLDSTARMNTPGTPSGNWDWRFSWPQIRQNNKVFLKQITEKYNR